jgi:hypothetical protein
MPVSAAAAALPRTRRLMSQADKNTHCQWASQAALQSSLCAFSLVQKAHSRCLRICFYMPMSIERFQEGRSAVRVQLQSHPKFNSLLVCKTSPQSRSQRRPETKTWNSHNRLPGANGPPSPNEWIAWGAASALSIFPFCSCLTTHASHQNVSLPCVRVLPVFGILCVANIGRSDRGRRNAATPPCARTRHKTTAST